MKSPKFIILCLCFEFSFLLNCFGENTIRITSGEWPPYISVNMKYYGVVSRIITEAFELEGVKVEYGFFPWKRSFYYAENGDWDGSIIWGYREERVPYFYYSDPVFSVRYVFFHLKSFDFDWSTTDDLEGIRLGFPLGYSFGDAFNEAIKSGKIKIDYVQDTAANFKKLLKNRVQICPESLEVGYYILLTQFTPKERQLITHHPKPLIPDDFHYLILSREIDQNIHMLALFNRGLKKLRDSGKIDQYFGESRRGEYILSQ